MHAFLLTLLFFFFLRRNTRSACIFTQKTKPITVITIMNRTLKLECKLEEPKMKTEGDEKK
jgi:hypothetical protein